MRVVPPSRLLLRLATVAALAAPVLAITAPAQAAGIDTISELRAAVAAGGTVTLGSAISSIAEFDGSVLEVGTTPVTLDLAGHDLSINSRSGGTAISVTRGRTLRIVNSGGEAFLSVTSYGGSGIGGTVESPAAGTIALDLGNQTRASMVAAVGDASGIGSIGGAGLDDVTIASGSISAQAAGFGAGIGGARRPDLGSPDLPTIRISGGFITAQSRSGTGIGTGGTAAQPYPGDVAIEVTGGNIFAQGPRSSLSSGISPSPAGAAGIRIGGTAQVRAIGANAESGPAVDVRGASLTLSGTASLTAVGQGSGPGVRVDSPIEPAIVIEQGATLEPTSTGSTAIESPSLLNRGTIRITRLLRLADGATLTNQGTITNLGTITGTGSGVDSATILNTGRIVGGGELRDSFTGTPPLVPGLKVTPLNFVVRFDSAGGTAFPDRRVYAASFADAGQVLPTPTREGYRFDGWRIVNTPVTDTTDIPTASGRDNRAVVLLTASWSSLTAPDFVTTALPDATFRRDYSQRVETSTPPDGVPASSLSVTDGALPPGLSLDGDSIVGIPTRAGDYSFTLTASSGVASSSRRFDLTVQKLPLTITPRSARLWGRYEPLEFTLAGVIDASRIVGDTALVSGDLICPESDKGTVTLTSSVGEYVLYGAACSGLAPVDPDNYRLTYADGTLLINTALTSIAVTGTQQYLGTPTFTYTVASSTTDLPLTGTVTCTTASLLRTNPNSVTRFPISPTLAVRSDYRIIGDCSGLSVEGAGERDVSIIYGGTFAVTKANATATVSATQTYGGSPTFTATSSGPTLTGTPSCTRITDGRAIDATLPAGSYPIDPASCTGLSLATADTGNYDLTYAAGDIVVSPKPVTVTPRDQRTTFGQPDPRFTFDVDGLVGNDTLTGVICYVDGPHTRVGTYPIVCTHDPQLDPDYVVETTSRATLTVTPVTVRVTPGPASGTYGSAAPSVSPSFDGFVGGDTASSVGVVVTCSSNTDATTHAGTYADRSTCTGPATVGDYAFDYTARGSVTIAQRTLTVTASSGSSVYGLATGPVTAGYDGFVNGDTAAVLDVRPTCSTTATASSNAGTYPTTCTGGSDGDYSLDRRPGTWTVKRADVTLTTSASRGLVNLLSLQTSFTAKVVSAATGAPVGGTTVTFTLDGNGKVACTTTTSTQGVATCSTGLVNIQMGTTFTATTPQSTNFNAGRVAGRVPLL